jgi:hypothetical protein
MKRLLTLLLVLGLTQLMFGQSLIKSVLKGDTEKVKKIVLKRARKINKQQDKFGNYALHTAVLTKRVDYVRLLAENGANINARNDNGRTPLMIAVMSSNYNCSEALWDYQPDISVKDIYGNTVLDMVKDEEIAWLIGTPDFLKTYVEHLRDLDRYVDKFPEHPNSKALGLAFYENTNTLGRLYELHRLNVVDPTLVDQKAATLVNSMEKLRTFKKKFPNSTNYEEAVRQVYPDASRVELLEILNIYPSLSYADELKILYVKKSKDIKQCIASLQQFPELTAVVEPIFYEMVDDLGDARVFKKYFPDSQYHASIVSNLYRQLSRSELKQLIDLYPQVNGIRGVKKRYIMKSLRLSDFMAATKEYPGIIKDIDQKALNYVDGYEDARLYPQLVKDSSLYADAYRKGITHTNKLREILDLKERYAGSVDSLDLQLAEKRYLEICSSLQEYRTAADEFPYLKLEIHRLAFEEIDNIKSAQQYIAFFPDSDYASKAAQKSRSFLRRAFDQCNSKREYRDFIATYSSVGDLYDPDMLLIKAQQQIEAIEEYEELMDICKTQAKTAGSQLMNCCSSFGGRGFSVDMNEDDVNINDLSGMITIPMKVNWYGSLSGRHYWIRGELIITSSGQRRWNKISDSGGFSPGCSRGCIR